MSAARIVPRAYQDEALRGGRGFPGIYAALREGPSTLLVLPTGTGKTVVFSRVVAACVERGRRALVVAHRQELIEQAAAKLVETTVLGPLDVGVEMGVERAGDHHRVVVASVQTLHERRLQRVDPAEFGLVVVDEAHHATAKTYERIIAHFSAAKLLGVTATPDRSDGRGIGRVFGSVAYVYEIVDAIAEGYLVPVLGRVVLSADIDLSDVRTTAGDFNQGDLAAVMEAQAPVALAARGTVDLAGDRPTLLFAVSVEQAHLVAASINVLRPGRAEALDGTAPPEVRAAVLDRFRRGEIQYLANCALFTEGVDIPSVACVSVARPTKSRALYAQMIGRGTRLLGSTIEESVARGKGDVLVLDFTGQSGRHKLVCCLDALYGNTDEEVRRRALARAQDATVDVQQVLDQVAREIVDEQRRRALEDVQYRTLAMSDPFAILGVRPRAGRCGGRTASVEQVERLKRHKIPGAEAMDYGQAEEVLASIDARSRRGLCTVRMAQQLIKHGLNPDAPYDVAKWAMDQLAVNKWRPTRAVLDHPLLKVGAADAA